MTGRSSAIAVVGSGYVGTVVAASFAHLGHRVIGIEIDPEKLTALAAGRVPFYEPGLGDLVAEQVQSGRLSFTDDYHEALRQSSLIFLCVGTPAGPDGDPDLTAMAAAARTIAGAVRPGHVIVTKSTVPIGNGPWLREAIEASLPAPEETPFGIVSNPEFLREGNAIHDFLHPERIVIGSDDEEALDRVAVAYGPILDQSFAGGDPDCEPELVRTDLATAETIKYAANAFLATKISFINEVAMLCEPFGADVTEVARAIGLDSRIGPRFLSAGVGWGGSCFGKDLAGLEAAARRNGLKPKILHAVQDVNREQRQVVVDKLRRQLGSLEGRRVAVLGLAFKPGTDDVRDSPAVDIVHQLQAAGALVTAHDPLVERVDALPRRRTFADLYDAADGAEAVVVATDWPDFGEIDFTKLKAVMTGRFFLDGRNMFQPGAVIEAGFVYEGIGRRASTSKAAPAPAHVPPAAAVAEHGIQPSGAARRAGGYEHLVKPVLDRLAGLVATVLTLPIVLATILAIWATMGRPAIFRQRRVGRGGREFTVYKLRTMDHDRRLRQQPFDGDDRRVNHKAYDDPRHTRLGRFLRKWSLDEIPQFWNVLLGQMSLVGPRPELVEVVARYQPWQHRRHVVKPGITGPWQISQRGDTPMHHATDVDLEYVERVSFLTDAKLLLQTIPSLLGRRGH